MRKWPHPKMFDNRCPHHMLGFLLQHSNLKYLAWTARTIRTAQKPQHLMKIDPNMLKNVKVDWPLKNSTLCTWCYIFLHQAASAMSLDNARRPCEHTISSYPSATLSLGSANKTWVWTGKQTLERCLLEQCLCSIRIYKQHKFNHMRFPTRFDDNYLANNKYG